MLADARGVQRGGSRLSCAHMTRPAQPTRTR
jgi:hypothetical protein